MNFWKELSTPLIGLSPMDDVTDAPTRKLVSLIAKPSVLMTEFVNVEGLSRGAIKMMSRFYYDDIERPIVAQIYGTEIESFYIVALICCELGFDGIDINMGCPAKKVAHRGAGAGLISTPDHAQKIIKTVQHAVYDYAQGKTLEEAQVRNKIIAEIHRLQKQYPYMKGKKKLIPVSVKTRIGCDTDCTSSWIPSLLECGIDALTLHGRTLTQRYSGLANWEVIARAAQIVQQQSPQTLFLGNGDIQSKEEAIEKINTYQLGGVLIGRGSFGNPWVFSGHTPTEEERKKTALMHSKIFEEIFPEAPFFIMRKHLGWYCKGFDGAKELRSKLMLSNSAQEVEVLLYANQ